MCPRNSPMTVVKTRLDGVLLAVLLAFAAGMKAPGT